jgi:hypothetical protein
MSVSVKRRGSVLRTWLLSLVPYANFVWRYRVSRMLVEHEAGNKRHHDD